MTTAELVNLIQDRLINAKVTFVDISYGINSQSLVRFRYGGVTYDAGNLFGVSSAIRVCLTNGTTDSYSQWVEGVLNGGARNDAGVVS